MKYKTCRDCGANLDHGEKCDCRKPPENLCKCPREAKEPGAEWRFCPWCGEKLTEGTEGIK